MRTDAVIGMVLISLPIYLRGSRSVPSSQVTPQRANDQLKSVTKDLGVLVVDAPRSLEIPFDLPKDHAIVDARPTHVEIARVCCTSFVFNEDWSSNPGGLMTVDVPWTEGRFIWTARVRLSNQNSLVLSAMAQVFPNVGVRGFPGGPVHARPGSVASAEGEVYVVHSQNENVDAPRIIAPAGVSAVVYGRQRSVLLGSQYAQSVFQVRVEVQAGLVEASRQIALRAKWDRGIKDPIEWQLIVYTPPPFIASPCVLNWKATDPDVKGIRLSGDFDRLEVKRVAVQGQLQLRSVKRDAVRPEIVIEVARHGTHRRVLGTIIVETDAGTLRVGAFQLAGG